MKHFLHVGPARACKYAVHVSVVAAILFGVTGQTSAQTLLSPGAPDKNVNIIGPTPDPANVPDVLLRQQNEPSCSIRPENPAFIFCAYNDYRATDFPFIQGDSWMGVSWSGDFGKTWFSRLAPGFKAHPNSLDLTFAADPNVVHAPGNSPGIAVLNYIAASRDLNDGVLAIQRWAAQTQEDVNFYSAEDRIIIVDETNNGRFADKPTLYAFVDEPAQQTTQSITMDLEDGTTVVRNVPSGTLVLAYAIFTGSNTSKIYVALSHNWGEDWERPVKLSEEQTRVQGVSVTSIGNRLVASWRRADSSNAIVYSYSGNGGKRWTKGAVATDLCPLDQAASSTQIRTIDFPWMANDGEYYYIFAADRRFGGDCATGISKLAMTYSDDGRNWSPLQPVEDLLAPNPFGEPSAAGYDLIPAAKGVRGSVQVAFYSTRRETLDGGLPAPEPPFMRDYLAGDGTIVNRKADVYTIKVRQDASGIPVASPAIRVSQYQTGLFVDPATGMPGLLETEAHFPNAPIFESGRSAFKGDYITAAATDFRLEDGKWVQNSASTGNDITDFEDVFLAWGDMRDLRGVYFAPTPGEPTPFTPNNAATTVAQNWIDEQNAEREKLLASNTTVADDDDELISLTAESAEDFPADFGMCVPSDPQDRTRDANVYGARVRAVSDFVALTPTKPLTGFQRTYPFVLSNPSPDTPRSFRLRIENQPPDFGPAGSFLGQASWNQLPSKPPFSDPTQPAITDLIVDVDPFSSAARTMFLVSNDPTASILVSMYDASCTPGAADCPVLVSRIVGGGSEFLDSEFCQNVLPGQPDACAPVNDLETHNPNLLNPDLQTPDLQTFRLLSPDLQTPDLQNPDLQTPDIQALGFMTPDLQTPDLQTPDLQTPDLQTPDLQAFLPQPELESSDDEETVYQDITYRFKNIGNVTTTYSADMTFGGVDTTGISAQLIAWINYLTPTSRECEYLPQNQNQILAATNLTPDELQTLTLPTVDDPFAGPITFPVVTGQTVNITLRVFGPEDTLSSLTPEQVVAATGFGASAHACNDANNIDPTVDCLEVDQEKIQIIRDNTPPQFSVEDGFEVTALADRPGGACVDLVGTGTISAEDNGEPVIPVCVATATGTAICTDVSDDALPLATNLPDMPTAVSCSATDAAGNVATVDLFVDVRDNTPPSFAPPLDGSGFEVAGTADLPAASPTESQVNFGPFAASDIVDETVDVECLPASGSLFGIGTTEVQCTARDDGYNLAGEINETMASFNVVVSDVTPPVGTLPAVDPVEANAPGGANFSYPFPDFTDNFDDPLDLVVVCTPASPAFLPLGSSTIACDATDTSDNMVLVTYDLEVVDTTAPEFVTIPSSPVKLVATGSGGATLDFTAQVEIVDVDGVDPDPALSCTATDGVGAGVPSGGTLPFGITEVSCTASDASGNTATDGYSVQVGYGSPFGIDFGKGKVKAGSSVPLSFGWTGSNGQRIDSSAAVPRVTARDCATGTVVLNPGEFPGNSNLRYDASQRDWKFNWQTVLSDGTPLPASSGGTNYCLRVISDLTGQTIPESGFTVIKIRR